MSTITRGKVARYALLPGIFPRLKRLLGPGQGILSSSIAFVFNAVRILPGDHAYLRPENRGKFGIRHVISEASGHLTWDWKHADQIILFFTILAGMIMFAMQFLALIMSLVTVPAFAITNYIGVDVPTSPLGIFVTPNPEQDMAFILLDLVFGIPDMFDSCITLGVECHDNKGEPLPYSSTAYPTPFQSALHEAFAMYSYGLFIVGCFIILYFAVTTVSETAVSGSPFGKRFNRMWAPVRLIFFFFLIVPIVYNLNIAQMATLHTAKLGSSMATNMWLKFNEALGEVDGTIIGDNEAWLVKQEIPEPGGYLQFMQTVTACKYAERILHNRYIQAYIVKTPRPGEDAARYFRKFPEGDNVTSPEPEGGTLTSLVDALKFNNNGDITLRFGEYNPTLYPTEKGHVYPFCGEVVLVNPGIVWQNFDRFGDPISSGYVNIAMYTSFMNYWSQLLGETWRSEKLHEWGSSIARNILLNENNPMPSNQELVYTITTYKLWMNSIISAGRMVQLAFEDFSVPDQIKDKGWAGAAIWYNRIANLNGGFITAVKGVPQPSKWPDAVEQILQQRKANNADISGGDRFNPVLGDGRVVKPAVPEDTDIARVERFAFNLWQNETSTVRSGGVGDLLGVGGGLLDGLGADEMVGLGGGQEHQISGNPLIDSINAVFGTSGLFDMRENPDVHPLAQLVGVGKSLVDSAIRAFGFSVGITMGGLLGLLERGPGSMSGMMTGISMTVGTTGLLTGALLYYVLPFMPFVYFFFALAGWVKAIFEAMVGVPLWALAHIRIDGDGLPGPGGMNGYFLIFEILLRPSLIVFGLIGSITIMAASVRVLNDVFDLAIVNLTGHAAATAAEPTELEYYRNAVSQFFYTIMYAAIVYMIAVSCFKLIDLVPDQIMRWLGTNVPGFGDAEKESAGQLMRTAYSGTMMIKSQAGGLSRSALLGHFFGGG